MLISRAQRRYARWSLIGALTVQMFLGVGAVALAQLGSGLISQQQAHRGGLERAWFARARVNPARSWVVRWILSGDELLVLTSAGLVQSLDANTGQTLWTTSVGNQNYPNLGPTTNDELVALLNGSTLYLLDRANGHILSERRVGGAPGAAPALSKDYVFVPLITGRVEGYSLVNPKERPWFYQSFGRVFAAPRATPHRVIWGTDAGLLYIANASPPGIQFRLESSGEFAASPAYREPLIYAVSRTGDLFAVDERRGAINWKYAAGFPTERAPAVVGDRLYVSTDEPMLHSIDAKSGVGQWETPGISQFAAATNSHVYGVDRFGTIHVLDKATGATMGHYPSGGTLTALVNDQTDRLFVITDHGMIQCFHEIGAKRPTYYVESPAAKAQQPEPPSAPPSEAQQGSEESPTKPGTAPPVPPQAGENENIFAPSGKQQPKESEQPAEASPFGVEGDNPFE